MSWYANIPVPTSYMAMGSRRDFFGGYDHTARAGLVHIANHHISPGKKQWTWGNHEFGYAWDRHLTEPDANGVYHPYIEIMAGVYTDNQPDFSFLHPGETRTFSQFWYPIQQIGPAVAANVEAAVSLQTSDEKLRVGVAASGVFEKAVVTLLLDNVAVKKLTVDIAPDRPLMLTMDPPPLPSPGIPGEGEGLAAYEVRVQDSGGRLLIEYLPETVESAELPAAATEPAVPREVETVEELYLIGLHLEQYRHATRMPETYWREALRRDSADGRCNNAMGLWHYRRGNLKKRWSIFSGRFETLTRRNPNQLDGEAFYNLGLALRRLNRDQQAYAAFYKATWNYAWQSPAFFALAELDCRTSNWKSALEHLDRCLRVNVEHLAARDLKVIVLRKLGRADVANRLLAEPLAIDPLDAMARHLAGKTVPGDAQVRLDLAIDFGRAGLLAEAIEVLRDAPATPGTQPLIGYHLACFFEQLGDESTAAERRRTAVVANRDYCFPARLEDIAVLNAAISADTGDSLAPFLLGNLFYDRRRHDEAIDLWERAAQIDPRNSICWRNLGIARFNIRHDSAAAKSAYERAFTANPADARLLYERDQLWKRTGESPPKRLAELQRHADLVGQRDDAVIELCALFNQTGEPGRAIELLAHRKFQPWEGGEGMALAQHVRSHLAMGRRALERGDIQSARQFFERALTAPPNLGEAKHLLANQSDIHYFAGVAAAAEGDREASVRHLTIAARARGDFQEMSVRAFSEMTYFTALALRLLGKTGEADQLFHDLLAYGESLLGSPAKIDYFATSLPTMLLFEDDPQQRQNTLARLLIAQAKLGLGDERAAAILLRDILAADPAHPLAADLLASVETSVC